jgi:MSHA biogenesis protein MshL
MDTLRELFGYEYRITGNRIFVYPNTVQTRLYRVNYLGRTRLSGHLLNHMRTGVLIVESLCTSCLMKESTPDQ